MRDYLKKKINDQMKTAMLAKRDKRRIQAFEKTKNGNTEANMTTGQIKINAEKLRPIYTQIDAKVKE